MSPASRHEGSHRFAEKRPRTLRIGATALCNDRDFQKSTFSIQCFRVSETDTVFGIASWTGGSVGIANAPARANAEAVIIPSPLPSELLPGPTSLNRMVAIPTAATTPTTITGVASPRLPFL